MGSAGLRSQGLEILGEFAEILQQVAALTVTGLPLDFQRQIQPQLLIDLYLLPQRFAPAAARVQQQGGQFVRRAGLIPARQGVGKGCACLLYTSPSPRDGLLSRMPSSA